MKKNGAKWTRELLAQVSTCRRTGCKVEHRYFDKYNKPDVKESLKTMYRELCCYCEARVGIVEFGNIEHRKPKRKFPDLTYAWTNMHLSCTACNSMKGEKYDDIYQILDAVTDNPITNHLQYKIDALGVWYEWKTLRGKTTVDDTDLNREGLRNARTCVLLDALNLIKKMKNNPNNPKNDFTKQHLEAMSKEEYGSVIAYALEFLR